jgi:hypothetical protein
LPVHRPYPACKAAPRQLSAGRRRRIRRLDFFLEPMLRHAVGNVLLTKEREQVIDALSGIISALQRARPATPTTTLRLTP